MGVAHSLPYWLLFPHNGGSILLGHAGHSFFMMLDVLAHGIICPSVVCRLQYAAQNQDIGSIRDGYFAAIKSSAALLHSHSRLILAALAALFALFQDCHWPRTSTLTYGKG
jgi:hypothetical protein